MQPEGPEGYVGGRTAAVILAAGQASRMGAPKTLLDFHGEPLIRHAARAALDAGYDDVLVVVDQCTEAVSAALCGLKVTITVNERASEGIGTSISHGVLRLRPDVERMALVLSDQPLVTSSYLAELRARSMASPCAIVASRYADTVGVPALFTRRVFPRLAELSSDQGCKSVITLLSDQAALMDCPEAAFDIDTPADYARLIAAPASPQTPDAPRLSPADHHSAPGGRAR